MWVTITAVQDGQYKGVLTNQPFYLKDIQQGDEVSFSREHIATILTPHRFDETQKAIITLRALEKKQVNWVLRDTPHNEKDSGWQLFYGNEDDAYLDDAGNATIITLEDVLEFEPLLEDVFATDGDAFDWSDSANRFVPNTTFHDFDAVMEKGRKEQDEINRE